MKSQPKKRDGETLPWGETIMYIVSFPLGGKCYYIAGTLLWGKTA